MKRPSIFNLMSHRQVINCPTALELCSLATEGTQEMKEIKEMLRAAQFLRFLLFLFPMKFTKYI